MKVCRLDEGNANFLTCPYHGWTFSSEGKLVTVPEYKEGYFEELNKEEWGLIPVSKVGTYKGLIFGTFDEGAGTLDEYLGDMRWYLDLMVDRTDEGLEVLPGVQKWTIEANWKFAADNFVGDSYHVPRTHAVAFELGIFPEYPDTGRSVYAGHGHGLNLNVFKMEGGRKEAVKRFPRSVLPYMHYLEERWERVERRLGTERSQLLRSLLAVDGTVFPNFSFLDLPGYLTFRVWQPKGPFKMEAWAWCLVEKGMPDELKAMVSRAYVGQFGVGGLFEQDDAEIWNQCTETARGRVTRRHPLNYQMGLGHEGAHPTMPGQIWQVVGEANHRGFYRRWADLINRDGKEA
jgi:hypothetical protein